jgi:pyrroline-5-carboxylate reductase
MRIGLIGAGSMATALARGWGEPLLVADPDRPRAEALAEALEGEVAESNRELARRCDLVVLCHKPAQLDEVAGQVGEARPAIASILWGVRLAELERAYPGAPVYRFVPNIPVEVRSGVLGYAAGSRAAEGPEREVLARFGRLGTVVPLEEATMDAAGVVSSVGPAFYALVVEALAEAGGRRGLAQADAARLAVEAMAGAAAYLRDNDHDTAGLRARVASPGGVTERGLASLERAGVRAAFEDAVAVVLHDEAA